VCLVAAEEPKTVEEGGSKRRYFHGGKKVKVDVWVWKAQVKMHRSLEEEKERKWAKKRMRVEMEMKESSSDACSEHSICQKKNSHTTHIRGITTRKTMKQSRRKW